MVMLVGAFVLFGCSSSTEGEAIAFQAEVAGQPAGDSSPGKPIRLHHGQVATLTVDAVNQTNEPVTISHVRLEGQLLDLIFLTYDTGIHETLQPGEQRQITFPLDFFDLDGQAHGLLRSQITLFDAERAPLGHQSLIIDGRGSPLATMAVFTAVLAALTVATLGWNLLRLGQRRLPVNRFARGLRFTHSGIGVGLALSAACSVLRIWPLPASTWVPVTAIAGLIGFAVGYLSPGSETNIDDLLIDLVDDGVVDAVVDTGSLPAVPFVLESEPHFDHRPEIDLDRAPAPPVFQPATMAPSSADPTPPPLNHPAEPPFAPPPGPTFHDPALVPMMPSPLAPSSANETAPAPVVDPEAVPTRGILEADPPPEFR